MINKTGIDIQDLGISFNNSKDSIELLHFANTVICVSNHIRAGPKLVLIIPNNTQT